MGILDSPRVRAGNLAADARRRPRIAGVLPSTMTSPPAVSYSAGGAVTTITNPTEIDIHNTAKIRRWGAQSFTDMVNLDYLSRPFTQGATIGPEFPTWAFAFITDAPAVDIVYLGSASPSYRLTIDGYYVTQYADAASGGSGQQHRLRLTLPTRKFRHIVVESASLFVSGITTSAIDTVIAPPAAPLKVAFMGDSYCANNGVDGIAPTVAKMLGAEWIVNGSGGTGYNNNQGGTGGKQKFIDRLPGLLAAAPDYLVTVGGINDGTGTFAADAAAYNAAVAAAGYGGGRHIVVGPWTRPARTTPQSRPSGTPSPQPRPPLGIRSSTSPDGWPGPAPQAPPPAMAPRTSSSASTPRTRSRRTATSTSASASAWLWLRS